MTKQPSYRFAGYTEPWEQKKLGEIAELYQPTTISSSELKETGYPVFGANGYIGYYDEYNHKESQVTISARGEGTGTPNFVVGPVWITGNSMVVNIDRNTEKIDKYFLFSNFLSFKFKKYVTGGAQPQLTREVLSTITFNLPSLPEQTAIGSFFQDIDQLISLQQRKLEVLKEQKKTYLKLLFPAKGQTKPALRFAGFEDKWKEVKLGKIGEIQTGNTPPTNEEDNYEKNGFPWVTPTDINSLVLHTTSKQLSEVGKSKARIAKSGSILVTCIASIGKNTLVRTDSAFNQQINSLTPSEKYSSYFLLTQSEIWSRYMLSAAGAGTMQIINKSDFSNIKTIVPSLSEQEAIGSFFQDLDKAIAKQEEKVNQLKESKQTFLKKMFI